MKGVNVLLDQAIFNSLKGAYLKIMMNYFQFLVILTNLDLNWFFQIKTILIVQAAPLGTPYKIMRISCLVGSNFSINFIKYI